MIKNKKVKKFISICLCMILLFGMGVQQTFAEGENSEVEKSEEIIQDEQDVADKNITIDNEQPDNQEENTEVSDTETSQEDSEQQEVLEIRKDEIITSMDEDGNITEIESENGTLEDEGISLLDGESSAKIVNFNTKGSAVTEYQEYGTGYDGYTNGMYGADAAYLGDENGKVKFMLSGVIGLVNPGEVQVVDINQASSLSYYTVSNGRLIHKITTNITKASYASSLDNGPAPNYLQESGTYYSYDGHYFYTRENFSKMIDDYNGGTRTNAINADNPYYNYFQYLPLRSKTAYTTDQLNNVLNSKIAGRTSAMTNMAGTFLNYQNQYGVNALIAIGVAANESAWGTSNIARNKNNLFGLNAVDTSPGQSANTYSSVDSCVKTFMETYMSKRYLNPNAGVYAGGYLGNKASGMNVKYASDPYWGEKNANIVWMIDKTYSNSEYANYTLAVKDTIGTEHTNLNVRKEASTSSTRIHTTKKYSNQSFIVLGNQNGFYKVQSDGALNSERSAISDSGNYNYDNMYVYVSDSYVKIVLEGKNGNGGNSEEISVPDSLKDVLAYQVSVKNQGWLDSAGNGLTTGEKNLPIEAMKVTVQNLEGVGVEYRAHVSNVGWQDTVNNGEQAGIAGQGNTIEAIQMKLNGENASKYNIYYRTYVEEYGWLDWAKNGELSGTQAYGYAVRGVQIALLPKGTDIKGDSLTPFKINKINLQYNAYVQNVGWQNSVGNGEISGTVGKDLRVEALKVKTEQVGIGVRYRVYEEDKGWQEYSQDGEISGTVGEDRRIEAVQIELTGNSKDNYDVYYRVHVQDKGWLGWAKNGMIAGTINYDLKVEAYQVLLVPKGTPEISNGADASIQKPTSVQYSAHVQNIGWQNYVADGEMAGTTARNLRLEALKLKLKGQEYSGTIRYSVRVAGLGWQNYVDSNNIAGTVGKDKQLEAIKVELTDDMQEHYDIYYRVHLSDFGWLGWAKNGAPAGNEGYNKKIEAVQVQLVNKDENAPGTEENPFMQREIETSVVYCAHVQDIGWQSEVKDGETAGTVGKSKRLEAFKISLEDQNVDGSIQYRAHVQDIGWQSYVNADEIAGTVGRKKAVEAIRIKLTGELAEKYDIYYRVHSANFGWLGWAKNGESAGSQGYSRQAEALEIRLVEKGKMAPGNTKNCFYKR